MGLSGLSSSERDMQRANAVGFAWKPTNLFAPPEASMAGTKFMLNRIAICNCISASDDPSPVTKSLSNLSHSGGLMSGVGDRLIISTRRG